MAEYLTIFEIGPVQSFTAASRDLRDVYAGSFLLSHLSTKVMDKAREQGAEILFPNTGQEDAPNRLAMVLKADGASGLKAICASLEGYMRGEWERVARGVIEAAGLVYTAAAESQAKAFVEARYASEPYQGGAGFRECLSNAMRRLGSAKVSRRFAQLEEQGGRKCDIYTGHNALFYRERKPSLVDGARVVPDVSVAGQRLDGYMGNGEALGAVAFMKRFLGLAGIDGFNDGFDGGVFNINKGQEYYAVVSIEREEFTVGGFSAEQARRAADWGRRENRMVIYANGGGFLGVMNLKRFPEALEELPETYGGAGISAGIIIARAAAPINAALYEAREARREARRLQNANGAFCLRVMKSGAETESFTLPLYRDGTNTLALICGLLDNIREANAPAKFIHNLTSGLWRLGEDVDNAQWRDMLLAETKRVLKPYSAASGSAEAIAETIGSLAGYKEFNLARLLRFMRVIAFIAEETGEGSDRHKYKN